MGRILRTDRSSAPKNASPDERVGNRKWAMHEQARFEIYKTRNGEISSVWSEGNAGFSGRRAKDLKDDTKAAAAGSQEFSSGAL